MATEFLLCRATHSGKHHRVVCRDDANRLKCLGAMMMLVGLGHANYAVSADEQAPASHVQADAQPSAATTEPPTDAIGEIVVTAQRREESLQKTSVVIDVISANQVARAGLTSPQNLTQVLPGVQISTIGPATQIYIRGVGDFGSTANSNPAVAFNTDGVYVGRSQSISSEFFDVERIEALKGPQGTLYGRNASGGAINLITHSPVLNELSGYTQAEFANFSSETVEAGVNIPLNSTLAMRVSGIYVNKGGYTSEDFGDDRHQAGRVKLLWEPDDDFSLLGNASYGHVGGRGPPFVLLNQIPGLANQSPWLDGTDPTSRAYIISKAFFGLPPIPGIVNPPTAGEGYTNNDFWNLSAQLNAKLGFGTLTVLPAYRDSTLRYSALNLLDFDVGAPLGSIPGNEIAGRPERSKQSSLEMRLSNENDFVKWVVGVYFYDEDQHTQYAVQSGLIQNVAYEYAFKTRSYAGFSQATFSVTNSVRLVGGLRYTADRRAIDDGASYNVVPDFPGCVTQGPPGTLCPLEQYAGARLFRNVTWKGGVEVDLSPQNLLYATASTGFKAGGFNSQASLGNPTEADSYGPEKLTAYELGIKNRFLDDRLQFNAEAFYWNYRDQQSPVIAFSGDGNANLDFINAGKSRLFGASIDTAAKPWRNGTFELTAEYVDSRYTDYNYTQPSALVIPGTSGCSVTPSSRAPASFGPFVNYNCTGFELPRSPKWSGTVGYTQVFEIGDLGSLDAESDAQFASARWLAPDFIAAERAPGYATLNFSLGYVAPADRYSVTAFTRNVTNARVYTGAYENPFTPGVAVGTIGPPRTYGVRFRVNFH